MPPNCRQQLTTGASSQYQRRRHPLASADWEAAITNLPANEVPSSSGERCLLLLAASIVGGIPVSLYDTVPGIDPRTASSKAPSPTCPATLT